MGSAIVSFERLPMFVAALEGHAPRDLALARLPDQVMSLGAVDPYQSLVVRLMQTFLWVY